MSGPETAAFITLVITGGITITRVATAFFNRHRPDASGRRGDAALEQRLARIEHAVEAIAIEVERVSEGQRFTTKLLAERPPVPTAEPGYARAGGDHAR
jgi:hypothetical protein